MTVLRRLFSAHRRWRVVVRAFAVGLLLIACGTATFIAQQYEGEPLPAERIAVLRLNGGSPVVFVALDGEELSYHQDDKHSRVHIEMLPGIHELEIGNMDDPFKRVVPVRFRAEAGKVYRVSIDSLASASMSRPWRPVVWEIDRETERALRVVPEVEQPPAPHSTAPSVMPAASATATSPAPSVEPAPTIGEPSAEAPTVTPSAAPGPSATAPARAQPSAAPSAPAPSAAVPTAAVPTAAMPPVEVPAAPVAP